MVCGQGLPVLVAVLVTRTLTAGRRLLLQHSAGHAARLATWSMARTTKAVAITKKPIQALVWGLIARRYGLRDRFGPGQPARIVVLGVSGLKR